VWRVYRTCVLIPAWSDRSTGGTGGSPTRPVEMCICGMTTETGASRPVAATCPGAVAPSRSTTRWPRSRWSTSCSAAMETAGARFPSSFLRWQWEGPAPRPLGRVSVRCGSRRRVTMASRGAGFVCPADGSRAGAVDLVKCPRSCTSRIVAAGSSGAVRVAGISRKDERRRLFGRLWWLRFRPAGRCGNIFLTPTADGLRV
jgi:hypothetical protein